MVHPDSFLKTSNCYVEPVRGYEWKNSAKNQKLSKNRPKKTNPNMHNAQNTREYSHYASCVAQIVVQKTVKYCVYYYFQSTTI